MENIKEMEIDNLLGTQEPSVTSSVDGTELYCITQTTEINPEDEESKDEPNCCSMCGDEIGNYTRQLCGKYYCEKMEHYRKKVKLNN